MIFMTLLGGTDGGGGEPRAMMGRDRGTARSISCRFVAAAAAAAVR